MLQAPSGIQWRRRFRSRLHGIFCPNQSTTSGVLMAPRRAVLAGKARFAGFDAGASIAADLNNGGIIIAAVAIDHGLHSRPVSTP